MTKGAENVGQSLPRRCPGTRRKAPQLNCSIISIGYFNKIRHALTKQKLRNRGWRGTFRRLSAWPSGSPDLNPLDYKLWSHLESMACSKRHNSLEFVPEQSSFHPFKIVAITLK
ncbi:uncharacterized protein LOC143913714 [Arctopsyche grandis]|uniref:uncharacterized protein LOC143913714 n=1 Tax=Arctopsyche grandis TaxID=121162 RepID=UPI00406D7C34